MGFFDWFRQRPTLEVECWLDEAGRWRGLPRVVAEDLAYGRRVIVVAHFKQALAKAGERLAAAGIPFVARLRWTTADNEHLLGDGPPAVDAVLASGLPDEPTVAPARPRPVRPVAVRVVDLHVLAAENERVTRFAASLPATTHVRACTSLEDPILAQYSKPWVRNMLGRMGMQQDESIGSAMVTKAIHRALGKLAAKVTGNQPADSIDEWLRRNVQP